VVGLVAVPAPPLLLGAGAARCGRPASGKRSGTMHTTTTDTQGGAAGASLGLQSRTRRPVVPVLVAVPALPLAPSSAGSAGSELGGGGDGAARRGRALELVSPCHWHAAGSTVTTSRRCDSTLGAADGRAPHHHHGRRSWGCGGGVAAGVAPSVRAGGGLDCVRAVVAPRVLGTVNGTVNGTVTSHTGQGQPTSSSGRRVCASRRVHMTKRVATR